MRLVSLDFVSCVDRRYPRILNGFNKKFSFLLQFI